MAPESPIDTARLDALWATCRAKRGLAPECVHCGGETTDIDEPCCSHECLRAADAAAVALIVEAVDALWAKRGLPE